MKFTKVVKSAEIEDKELFIGKRLASELNNVGLCLSNDTTKPNNIYFVTEVDAKYGIKAKFYSVQRGTIGLVRISKGDYAKKPFEANDCIKLIGYNKSPRYSYRGGEKVALPGEMDIWIKEYEVIKAPKIQEGDKK